MGSSYSTGGYCIFTRRDKDDWHTRRSRKRRRLLFIIKDYHKHFTKEKSFNKATPVEQMISKHGTPTKCKTGGAATQDDKATPQDAMPVKETPKKQAKCAML